MKTYKSNWLLKLNQKSQNHCDNMSSAMSPQVSIWYYFNADLYEIISNLPPEVLRDDILCRESWYSYIRVSHILDNHHFFNHFTLLRSSRFLYTLYHVHVIHQRAMNGNSLQMNRKNNKNSFDLYYPSFFILIKIAIK